MKLKCEKCTFDTLINRTWEHGRRNPFKKKKITWSID